MNPMANSLEVSKRASSSYWMANIKRQGVAPFNSDSDYKVFRNVKDFGAKGMFGTRSLIMIRRN
jgi:glucan 1,3-beta-glucosidase